MNKRVTFPLVLAAVVLALAACRPEAPAAAPNHTPPTPTSRVITIVQVVVTNTPTPTRLRPTQTPTRTPRPTRTPGPTRTPSNTPTASQTPLPTDPPATPLAYQNTPIPSQGDVFSAANPSQAVYAAQWGRGSISAVAYAPDGSFFAAGSMYGVAVYQPANLDEAPAWHPFLTPIYYDRMAVSADGLYLRLQSGSWTSYFDLSTDEQLAAAPEGAAWQPEPSLETDRYGGAAAFSPDGSRKFEGYVTCKIGEDNECTALETAFQRMVDTANGEVLYQAYDIVPQITFEERHAPEGCDLNTFSLCGNALMPLASSPYRAAFSPDGRTFAVIYRPPGLGNSKSFSVMRVFRAADGKVLQAAGSYNNPVQDFAYSPAGDALLIGFVNGAVQLVDTNGSLLHSARHFSAPIERLVYSNDSRYLLAKHNQELEIRRTSDGAVRARLEAAAFALSPRGSLLALADLEGNIRVMDMDTWRTIHFFKAHDDLVFSLAFSDDGRMLASSGQDCAVKVWDIATGEFLHPNETTVVDAYGEGFTESRIFVKHLQFVPGTSQLIGFGSWGTVVSWNANSGATNYLLESAPLEYYNGMVTIQPHFPEYFATDLENDVFYINDLGYNILDGSFAGPYQPLDDLPAGCAQSGPITPDGTLRFTRGYDDKEGQICVLNNETLSLIQLITVIPEPEAWYEAALGWLYLSPDGTQLATHTWDGAIYVFEIAGN